MDNTLEDRVGALESSAKRWRLSAIMLAVSLIGAIGWGAERTPPVSALRGKSLTIVADDGFTPVLNITAQKEGASISCGVAGGEFGTVTLASTKDGGFLSIVGRDVRNRLLIGGGSGGGSVRLYDAKGAIYLEHVGEKAEQP